jgi:hypothetical protein
MKKQIIGLLAVFALAVSVATAQTVATTPTAPATTPTVQTATPDVVNFTVGYEDQYLFRGVKVADNVADASLALSLPSKTNFDVISYWNTTNRTPRVGDETDYAVSQGFALDSVTDLRIGTTVYTYPRVAPLKGNTTYSVEPFTSLTYKAFLSPTVLAAYDVNLREIYVEGDLSQRIPLVGGLSLVPAVGIGYATIHDLNPESNKPQVKNSYYYGTGKIDLVYSPVKFFDVGVGLRTNYLNNSAIVKNNWAGGFATVKF